jgi:DNA polymerase-3 subunit alpha
MRLTTLEESCDLPDGTMIKTALIVPARKEYITKRGDKMAFCTVEDLSGMGELTMLPNVYALAKPLLEQDLPLYVEAKVDKRGAPGEEEGPKQAKLLAEKVELLGEVTARSDAAVVIDVLECICQEDRLADLRSILEAHKGPAPVLLRMRTQECLCTLELGNGWRVRPDSRFWKQIDEWREDVA